MRMIVESLRTMVPEEEVWVKIWSSESEGDAQFNVYFDKCNL